MSRAAAGNMHIPRPGASPVRCGCGWWYRNVGGRIFEKFNSPFSNA